MKKDTKIDVIKRSMNPGCTISSGRWKAYTDLTHSIIQYYFEEHKSFNHSKNCLNPFDKEAYTLNIEAFSLNLRKLRVQGLIQYAEKNVN